MSSGLSDLGVPADVESSLAARGITEAFPIQSMAIPPALAGKDVSARAPTGSGKTLAFGIPLVQRVGRARRARPRALVLAPTRELAAQIHNDLRSLLSLRGRTIASFYGGVSFEPQLKALRRGVDVAVACPGRLADLVRRGDLVLDEVEIVVVDEADRMADMGFLPEVTRILDQVRPNRQTLLFSATLDGDVDVLVKRYQRNPVRCEAVPGDRHIDRTSHHFLDTNREDRVRATVQIIGTNTSTLVFCRTKHGADRLAKQLQRAGLSAAAIHGGRSQSQRDRALASFAQGKVQTLVATDVAARGIHVDDVGCVVHFDLPAGHKDYLHRSGRTGRAGADGVVVSLVTEADRANARRLQEALDLPLHTTPSLNASARSSAPAEAAPSRRRQLDETRRNRGRRRNAAVTRGGAEARRRRARKSRS